MQDYQSAEASSAVGAAVGIFSLFYLAIFVLLIASMWKIFEKAGKPGWAAIIPIYNVIILVEIIGKPSIWVLWNLIPCVNFIFGIWSINLLCKSFGKSEGYTVGLIIFPFIFFPMLGFGDAKYLGPSAAEANGGAFNPNNPFGNVNNPLGNINNPFNKPEDKQDPPVV